MNTLVKPKRGTFATDRRTGQVVKIAEHGRGGDVMVKTAYKTDGYWTSVADLERAEDPHAWSWKQLVFLLIALAAGVFTGINVGHDFAAHGYTGAEAFWYALPSGFLATWLVSLWTNLFRV